MHGQSVRRLSLFLIIGTYCSYMSSVNSVTVKTCNAIKTFQQMFGISLPQCAEECFRRQRCEMFMFHFGMKHCALKDDITLQSYAEEDPICRYYTRGDWSQIDLGPCNGHYCSETERCTSKTDDEIECVRSECPIPDEISDASLLSNTQSIGAKSMYKCNNGFIGQGNPSITCRDDASWSPTDFLCISKHSCPIPEHQSFNAELTHVDGSLYTLGTILTYTCGEGYRKMDAKVNITCQESLLWDSDRINCCPESSTHRADHACVAIINGRIATSNTDAQAYCRDLGGWLSWTHTDMIDLYDNTTTELALQYLQISKIPTDWYTNCATANGVFVDDSISLREKIDTVVDNNWIGLDCWYGRKWSPGQPDFNGDDDCVIRFVDGPDHGYHDYPCTFGASVRVGFACRFFTPFVNH